MRLVEARGFMGSMPAIREDLWVPLATSTAPGINDWKLLHRENGWLNVVGRLRPGVSRRAATQDVEVAMHTLVTEHPAAHLGVNTITLDPMWRSPFGGNRMFFTLLPVLLAFAALVLLLTCANVATLMLVRFVARADDKAPRVTIVDQTTAARYWPGKDPLGQRLRMWNTLYTVVGVAKNSTHGFITETPEPMVYNPILQSHDPETTLQVRTPGDPEAVAPMVVEAIHQIDPRWLVYDVRPLHQTTQSARIHAVLESTFASAFGLLSLVLATSGIYGVLAYRTQLRTHEIGIRIALGARRKDVLWLILRQGLRLATLGIVLGIALGIVLPLALTHFTDALLYGVSPVDPLNLLLVALLLALVAGAASSLPAFRAMRIDPMAAIHEP